MDSNKLRTIILTALFISLTAVGTMAIKIPIVATQGYIHLGDTLVYLSGIILGPIFGSLAAGLGSMFADLFLGYTAYALPTFIIKALDAMVFGIVFKSIDLSDQSDALIGRFLFALLLGGTVMVGGYYIVGGFFYGFKASLVDVPANIIQAVGGGIIAYIILVPLRKIIY